MYINDLHILTYVVAGIIGLIMGQWIDWCNLRLPEYKKVLSRDFFKEYLKNAKPKYLLMVIVAVAYIALLFFNGLNIDTIQYMILIPMLLIAFPIGCKVVAIFFAFPRSPVAPLAISIELSTEERPAFFPHGRIADALENNVPRPEEIRCFPSPLIQSAKG